MSTDVWGDKETQFFYQLTPEKILNAIEESSGLRCTGRVMPLNSMENRVYEIEIDLDEKPKSPSDKFRIAKFYRPGRWSEAQILEEHQFLNDLVTDEIPAVAASPFLDGKTLHKLKDADIFYTLFPKIGGRSPDELDQEQLQRVGRLLARMHNVGASRPVRHRLSINPDSYGRKNLAYLLSAGVIPEDIKGPFEAVVKELCDTVEPWFEGITLQRIHGDCHLGNLLFGREGFFWVDFDDMVKGPPVQDLWLMIPGRDQYAQEQLKTLIEAYEMMRPFDHQTLRLIEPLRALRFIHFAAWIAKRWQDPAFPRAFPHFGTPRYWQEQLLDLKEQLAIIQGEQGFSY